MRIEISSLLFGLMITSTVNAYTIQDITPYARMTSGVTRVTAGQDQTVTFSPSYWKTDIANRDPSSTLFAGVSAGLRLPVAELLEMELGLGLYQTGNLKQSGKVYQYDSPDFHNLNYVYQIKNQRLMFEGKLLATYYQKYHPYISAGVGASRNKSTGYKETAAQSFAMADPAFTSATKTSMAYSAGVGVDVDIDKHWRVGAGIEFINFGTAKLGKAPTQQSAQQLSSGSLKGSQFMIQLTYTG
jgi:opacity protein-like surface antigen